MQNRKITAVAPPSSLVVRGNIKRDASQEINYQVVVKHINALFNKFTGNRFLINEFVLLPGETYDTTRLPGMHHQLFDALSELPPIHKEVALGFLGSTTDNHPIAPGTTDQYAPTIPGAGFWYRFIVPDGYNPGQHSNPKGFPSNITVSEVNRMTVERAEAYGLQTRPEKFQTLVPTPASMKYLEENLGAIKAGYGLVGSPEVPAGLAQVNDKSGKIALAEYIKLMRPVEVELLTVYHDSTHDRSDYVQDHILLQNTEYAAAGINSPIRAEIRQRMLFDAPFPKECGHEYCYGIQVQVPGSDDPVTINIVPPRQAGNPVQATSDVSPVAIGNGRFHILKGLRSIPMGVDALGKVIMRLVPASLGGMRNDEKLGSPAVIGAAEVFEEAMNNKYKVERGDIAKLLGVEVSALDQTIKELGLKFLTVKGPNLYLNRPETDDESLGASDKFGALTGLYAKLEAEFTAKQLSPTEQSRLKEIIAEMKKPTALVSLVGTYENGEPVDVSNPTDWRTPFLTRAATFIENLSYGDKLLLEKSGIIKGGSDAKVARFFTMRELVDTYKQGEFWSSHMIISDVLSVIHSVMSGHCRVEDLNMDERASIAELFAFARVEIPENPEFRLLLEGGAR